MKWPLIDPNFAIYQPDSLRARCKEKGEEGRGGEEKVEDILFAGLY